MRITKQDTNGVKPLLEVGEFGYDDYPAGGDAGRVWVGTGSENLAVAKKVEIEVVETSVNDHIDDIGNPHGVTKAQVGLGLVSNKLESDLSVYSAARLTTPVEISGVSFNGTSDIDIPFSGLVSTPTTIEGYGITNSDEYLGDRVTKVIE